MTSNSINPSSSHLVPVRHMGQVFFKSKPAQLLTLATRVASVKSHKEDGAAKMHYERKNKGH